LPDNRPAFLARLNEEQIETFTQCWEFFVHAHQQPPPGIWTTWLVLGGRGAGKTRTGAEWVRGTSRGGPAVSPIALVGETEHDAREVMVEGVSGLLGAHQRMERPNWIPSRRRLEWPNGAVAQVFSAEDPESLRGPQFAAAWCDELAKWRHAESSYTNHPSDPGGPTNFGITIEDYRRYVKPDATAADVKAMKVEEAKAIYKARYWDAMHCDELPVGVDYAVFDFGVNSGVSRAAKVLQRTLDVAADGIICGETLKAAIAADPKTLIASICDERLSFLKRLKTWPVFGTGWGRRVSKVRTTAIAMASQARPAAKSMPIAGKGFAPARTPARGRIAGAIASIGTVLAGWSGAGNTFNKENIMATFVLLLAAALGGYIASIFTWPRLRQAAVGIDNEIDDLKAKARALETRLKG